MRTNGKIISRRRLFWNVVFVLLAGGFLRIDAAEAARTWTSTDGSKTFVGTLKAYEPSKKIVTVVLQNGRELTFGQQYLSEDDVAYVVDAAPNLPKVNSLGMTFVPVEITKQDQDGGRVFFSIWETRVSDFKTFLEGAENYSYRNKKPTQDWAPPKDLKDPDLHPAVYVSWDDANAFCAWLTKKERKEGRIGPKDRYRLPTDHEWSCAVGIGDREDPKKAPPDKKNSSPNYPWGKAWPPPHHTENIGSAEGDKDSKVFIAVEGYKDGYGNQTAPVGSYPASKNGLHDLGGNVKEWVQESHTFNINGKKSKQGVVRGGDFNEGRHWQFKSSFRRYIGQQARSKTTGFRCVLEVANTP